MKTNELTGAALDWAVAKAWQPVYSDRHLLEHAKDFHPSTNWALGGPIIDRECICIECSFAENVWSAWTPAPEREFGEAYGNGPTPLIAAMRCYVASRLGDEIEVPKELF